LIDKGKEREKKERLKKEREREHTTKHVTRSAGNIQGLAA
jgi:hypothetical protein